MIGKTLCDNAAPVKLQESSQQLTWKTWTSCSWGRPLSIRQQLPTPLAAVSGTNSESSASQSSDEGKPCWENEDPRAGPKWNLQPCDARCFGRGIKMCRGGHQSAAFPGRIRNCRHRSPRSLMSSVLQDRPIASQGSQVAPFPVSFPSLQKLSFAQRKDELLATIEALKALVRPTGGQD
ncbi:uncharacterized protein BJX67DRAFT_338719 [Aspergillus lucknowensis]|uniref:Uncharacterized protein n=1 Tax=Aspergillus lucknowensis TaxID=176173 RepID=A0ABR4L5N3_9EURO